jgi:hypothetical protein
MDTRVKRYGSRFRSAESVDYKREAETCFIAGGSVTKSNEKPVFLKSQKDAPKAQALMIRSKRKFSRSNEDMNGDQTR